MIERYVQSEMPYLKTPITAQNDGFYPQQMQPNPPNQSPDEKPHAVCSRQMKRG